VKNHKNFIGGALVGIGLMYLFNLDWGRRRRALLRDKSVHVRHRIADRLSGTARDLRNRTIGAAAELRSWLRDDAPSDEVLHERVREAIGRVVLHPSAVAAEVSVGCVRLHGAVLEQELDRLVRAVRRVQGTREVLNELQVYRDPDAVASLQGS